MGLFLLFSAHAVELGNPVPEKPILFLKPTTAYLSEGQKIKVRYRGQSFHYQRQNICAMCTQLVEMCKTLTKLTNEEKNGVLKLYVLTRIRG